MKLRRLLLLMVLLCVSMTPAQPQKPAQRTAAEYVQEINQVLRDADRADLTELDANAAQARAKKLAAQYAAQVKATQPAGLDRAYLGYLLSLADDLDNAIAVFREVLNDAGFIDEHKQEVRLHLIRKLCERGRLPEAQALVEAIPKTAFNADETFAQAYQALAIALTKQEQLDQALELEEKAMAAARQSGLIPLIWTNARWLGEIYVAVGRTADAIKLLSTVKADLDRQKRFASGESAEVLENSLNYVNAGLAQFEMIGKPAPEFAAVKWLEEAPSTLVQLKGKVVGIELWAAWCSNCRAFAPSLRDWATRFGKDGFKIVAVTRYYGFNGQEIGSASKAAEEAFLTKFKRNRGLPYGTALDDGQKSFDAYHVQGIPTLALVDRQGVLRFVFSWHENPALCQYVIKKLLAEPAAAVSNN